MSDSARNYLFAFLWLAAAVCAMALPPEHTDQIRAQVQGLLAPAARPIRYVAAAASDVVGRDEVIDDGGPNAQPRTEAEIIEENRMLRAALASRQQQLEVLQQINADREKLGPIRDLCEPFMVAGSDAGQRDTLALIGSSLLNLEAGQAVLYRQSLVGFVDRAGASGGQVRLVSDRGFVLTGAFGRFHTDGDTVKFILLNDTPQLMMGKGRGRIVVESISMVDAEAMGIQVGDWFVLRDNSQPDHLQGIKLGQVASIDTRDDAALFASITLRTETDLMKLREVMVMTGKEQP